MDESGERKGWWGSTLSKLKTALSKTKTQITGVEGEEGEVPSEQPDYTPEAQQQTPVEERIAVPQPPQVEEAPVHEEAPQPVHAQKTVEEPQTVSTPHAVPTPMNYSGQDSATARSEQPAPVSAKTATVEPPRPTKTPTGPAIQVNDDYLEDLEDKLIKADIGVANVQTIVGDLKRQAKGKTWTSHNVLEFLRQEFTSILKQAPSPKLKFEPGKVNIYLVVGVNGTGKTTSIGKLCWRFKQEGKKVLMAAGDTFRAAAETQLEIWSKRADVDIVRLPDGSDPGAVVFNAIQKAKQDNYDCVVIDTAGRLHNKSNLMDELKKIRGVVEKHGQGLPLECMLVLDASTGQNGLQQAKLFTEICTLTGVILTKLDGTAKGGIVFSIARDLKIPVKLIGLGEQIDDLRDFEPELFVEALF